MPSGFSAAPRRRRLSRHHGDAAAAAGQHAQDVALDAEVVGDDVEARLGEAAVAAAQRPLGLGPDGARTASSRPSPGPARPCWARTRGDGLFDVRLHQRAPAAAVRCSRSARHSCAALGSGGVCRCSAIATVPSRCRYCRSVSVACGSWTCAGRQVLDDQTGGVDLRSASTSSVDAVAADVRVRQRDDLAAVAGVGEDFLVAGERGVEHHLADGAVRGADRDADEDRAVCENEECGGQDGQQGNETGAAPSSR
jgi:hypothetical protein